MVKGVVHVQVSSDEIPPPLCTCCLGASQHPRQGP